MSAVYELTCDLYDFDRLADFADHCDVPYEKFEETFRFYTGEAEKFIRSLNLNKNGMEYAKRIIRDATISTIWDYIDCYSDTELFVEEYE